MLNAIKTDLDSSLYTKAIELFLTTHSNGELRKGKWHLHGYQAHTKRRTKTVVQTANIDEVSDAEESSEIFEVNLEEISSDENQWTDSESDDDDDKWMNIVLQWASM